MASEATKVAAPANTHIDHMVIEVSLFESDVKFDLQGHWGYLEATNTSEAILMVVIVFLDNQQQIPE